MINPGVMANQGSPMLQPMSDNQFMGNMPMPELYGAQIRANGAMQGGPGGAGGGNHALQDYQMQLMLLEQQNKKRLMMARQEQDNISRDGGPMPGQPGMPPPGMSPSGSRTGNSPNPSDQMKRGTPQLGGLPGSPGPGDGLQQGRGSPASMNFMGGIPQDFNNSMLMKNGNDGMAGPGGPAMRPGGAMNPNNFNVEAMARAQQGRMPGGNWQAGQQGQPMMPQSSQGQPQPMGTPGQRSDMPPPQAPATGSANANRTQPSSPQPGQAPPTPSQSNKPAPKKKDKNEPRKVCTPEFRALTNSLLIFYSAQTRRTPLPMLPRHQNPSVQQRPLHQLLLRLSIPTRLLVPMAKVLQPETLLWEIPRQLQIHLSHCRSNRFPLRIQAMAHLEIPISRTRVSTWTLAAWSHPTFSMNSILTAF